ncbi:MAG: hypothetical protein J6T48_05350 [Bacteroidales bacterium]|nr:hypothetical protein [Bacteroidales bacterium]
MAKTKVVLDADVLIHFAKGGMLSVLPSILPEFEHIILKPVYDEIKTIRSQVDNQVNLLKNISLEDFNPQGEMMREYAVLSSNFGRGESACMAYCKFTNNVIGSSNLKDIKDYCAKEQITYLTTLDFLYYAYKRGKITDAECRQFVSDVISKGSHLPSFDVTSYIPSVDI